MSMTNATATMRSGMLRSLSGWYRRLTRSRKQTPPVALADVLDGHLALDREIDKRLTGIMRNTEVSALFIIEQVRHLHTTASQLVADLDGSGQLAQATHNETAESVAYVVDIGAFLSRMPDKVRRDMARVHELSVEIQNLSGMASAVQAISMQSHLLAINAAIQASHTGVNSAAFHVVADEMRKLASDSGAVAGQIAKGLCRAQQLVDKDMAASLAESTQQLAQVSRASDSIQKVLDNFDHLNQYYAERFAQATRHNAALAGDIAEVLGQIQFQDVVRQSIERIQVANKQRNALFETVRTPDTSHALTPSESSAVLASILQDYLDEDSRHAPCVPADTMQAAGTPKIELF